MRAALLARGSRKKGETARPVDLTKGSITLETLMKLLYYGLS